MSTNDVLDVLNISRDDAVKQPVKKKSKVANDASKQTGMARELYSLLGPNTPPVNLNQNAKSIFSKDKLKMKVSPWTWMPFEVNGKTFHHWVKGSRELLDQERGTKPYFFEKFSIKVEIPDLCDKDTYETYLQQLNNEKREQKLKEEKEKDEKESEQGEAQESDDKVKVEGESRKRKASEMEKESEDGIDFDYEETAYLWSLCQGFELKWPIVYDRYDYDGPSRSLEELKEHFYRISIKLLENPASVATGTGDEFVGHAPNTALVDSLRAFSKKRETDRKRYLENLLRRTPAEIAEEESLVIEARRFEMAAKKMLAERTNLLALLDSPQSTQQVQQYSSSQGLANLYNNLMIYDKHQKKKQSVSSSVALTKSGSNPVPPAIPPAASSSVRRDRAFQTHLQQYLASFLKQTPPPPTAQGNAIKQLLQKRLSQKEEEAYGLYYHSQDKMTPGVTLRSSQRLPAIQQKQSTLKSVQMLLQELDIPTGGGTTWRPVMATRKTMTKYDELIRAAVALLDVKKAKDKLEAEIRLVKSQRGVEND